MSLATASAGQNSSCYGKSGAIATESIQTVGGSTALNLIEYTFPRSLRRIIFFRDTIQQFFSELKFTIELNAYVLFSYFCI